MPLLHWLTRDDDIHAAAQTPYRLLEEVASREGYPGRFLMMVEGYCLPLFAEHMRKLVYIRSTSTIPSTFFQPEPFCPDFRNRVAFAVARSTCRVSHSHIVNARQPSAASIRRFRASRALFASSFGIQYSRLDCGHLDDSFWHLWRC